MWNVRNQRLSTRRRNRNGVDCQQSKGYERLPKFHDTRSDFARVPLIRPVWSSEDEAGEGLTPQKCKSEIPSHLLGDRELNPDHCHWFEIAAHDEGAGIDGLKAEIRS